jgi:hypothetical protein
LELLGDHLRRSNFPLRLASSLLEEARKVADDEGVALNQLINIAVAEKISALRTEDFFRERALRANIPEALHILDKAGFESPQAGDELPAVEVQTAIDPVLDQLLRNAIQTKHLLRFRYKGQERILEPHDYGIQNGIVRLFSWQVGGRSSRRNPRWRMFDVEGIQNCELLDKRFAGNRDVPTGKHHLWDEIFIRVTPRNENGR